MLPTPVGKGSCSPSLPPPTNYIVCCGVPTGFVSTQPYCTLYSVLYSVAGQSRVALCHGHSCGPANSNFKVTLLFLDFSWKMRPISASDALRQVSPRKLIGSTFNTVNRFSFLRDVSPAPPLGTRGRSVSISERTAPNLVMRQLLRNLSTPRQSLRTLAPFFCKKISQR